MPAVLAVYLALPSHTFAQAEAEPADQATISGNASTGAIAANVAAGTYNQQANVMTIADGDAALSLGILNQNLETPAAQESKSANASIAPGAFVESEGRIALNVLAGTASQQANVAVFAVGIDGPVANGLLLSQSRASIGPPVEVNEEDPPSQFDVQIGDGALAGSSGLIQINLSSGNRNSSANVFALTTAGRTP